MAICYTANINDDTLLPLLGHRVIIFPHGDGTHENFLFYKDIAQQTREAIGLDIYVSALAEEQKQQGLDLVDYIVKQQCGSS
jgi:hypothetical protein